MKAFLALTLALGISNTVFASGSVSCDLSPGPLSTLNISVGTTHAYGSPLLTDLKIEGSGKYSHLTTSIPRKQIVNYKEHDSELFIMALDSQAHSVVLKIDYDFKKEKGTAMINLYGNEMTFSNINCGLE